MTNNFEQAFEQTGVDKESWTKGMLDAVKFAIKEKLPEDALSKEASAARKVLEKGGDDEQAKMAIEKAYEEKFKS